MAKIMKTSWMEILAASHVAYASTYVASNLPNHTIFK